jgi:ATP-dependent Clp protease ATP-binding subunit ClpB
MAMALRYDRLTLKSQEAVQQAQSLASGRLHQRLEPMHLLAALMHPDQQDMRSLLGLLGASPVQILKAAEAGLESLPKVTGGEQTISPELSQVLEASAAEADRLKVQSISVELLLLALVKVKSKVQALLGALGITEKEVFQALQKVRGGQRVTDQNSEGEYPALESYGRDLVDLARKGKMDPVMGRDDETRRVIEILLRRSKNNPVLIGKPGVGKTAIVESLAQRIVSHDVPESLQRCRVFTLDVGFLVAGTRSRGEIQERLKAVLEEATRSNGRVILFLDELHSILGADEADGGLDAGHLLKPSLARGGLPCIGATTAEAYREVVARDPALERRFQPVSVGEPSIEEAVAILRVLKERYEIHHKVTINDSALLWAARLASIYILDRFLPDKAIDLVDEACSRLSMELQSVPTEIDVLQRRLLRLRSDERMLRREEEEHARKRLAEVELEIEQVDKDLQDLRGRWEMERSGLGDIQGIRERLEAVKSEFGRAWEEVRHMQLRGERPDERQFQALASLDYERKQLEARLAEKEHEEENNRAEGVGDGRIRRARSLLRKQVNSEEIADLVSQRTGISFAEIFATGQTDVMSPPAESAQDTTSGDVSTTTVFISHSVQDREYVEREIIAPLRSWGLQAWYSTSDIRPTDRWERKILEALRACEWFLVAMSPRSAQSEWVRDEVNWAMNYRIKRIIPVMIDNCDLSEFHIRMPRIQYIDFRDRPEVAQRRLLAIFESNKKVSSEGDDSERGASPPEPDAEN